MKKNLKNSWLKNNIALLNIIIMVCYGLSWLISKKFNFNPPINIIGFLYLLILTPLNLTLIIKLTIKNFVEGTLLILTIFLTIIGPFYFIINHSFQIPFSFVVILSTNIIISLITMIIYPNFNINFSQLSLENFLLLIKKILHQYWSLLIILFLYLLLHSLCYHFYVFMPEWDGYSKLIEIKNALQSNTLETNYRGFFTVAIIIIAKFTKLSPYTIFSTLLIILQTSLIFVIFLFLKIYRIKNKWHQLIILLTTLSVPVLNMEIDAVRPQNSFIILLPIYIYFLYKALNTKQYTYWLVSSLIAIMGLNYHEFFAFIFLMHCLVVLILIFKKYFIKAQTKKDRLLFKLLIVIFFLSSILFMEHSAYGNYFIDVIKDILSKVQKINTWRWWFIDNYSGDGSGQQLGWHGIAGAAKYYAYYASPTVLFGLFLMLFLTIKKKITINFSLLLYIILPAILTLLFYNEILPRLNYIYLPERIWLIIDILVIFFFPVVYTGLKNIYSRKILSLYLFLLIIFSIIGLAGSFYIAKNKKSLTSKNEYQVAQWIKKNTPKNSIFITQGANGPMVRFFAERKLLSGSFYFFNTGNKTFSNKLISPQTITQQKLEELKKSIQKFSFHNIEDIDNAIIILKNAKKNIRELEKTKQEKTKHLTKQKITIYALYSEDKFKGIYAHRQWWLKANYYGANINNLTKKYPLIYNKNGIYIWKIK